MGQASCLPGGGGRQVVRQTQGSHGGQLPTDAHCEGQRPLAFKALPQTQQRGVLTLMVRDEKLREDVLDIALIEERSDEPERPLRAYLGQPLLDAEA